MELGITSIFGEKRPILCVTERNTKKAIPILVWGLPKSVWVGICQDSKLGSPQTTSGFIPIWGPTHIPALPFVSERCCGCCNQTLSTWSHASKIDLLWSNMGDLWVGSEAVAFDTELEDFATLLLDLLAFQWKDKWRVHTPRVKTVSVSVRYQHLHTFHLIHPSPLLVSLQQTNPLGGHFTLTNLHLKLAACWIP